MCRVQAAVRVPSASMLRTIAVLFLLLGLATATPVVCLCTPTVAASNAAGLSDRVGQSDDGSAVSLTEDAPFAPARAADAPSLIASGAAAVVASLVATAGGVPLARPWQLPHVLADRLLHPTLPPLAGLTWSPAVPPPR